MCVSSQFVQGKPLQLDLRITELLVSRFCHDLASGIGGINNGIEFVSEFGADMSDDAIALIALSASQLSSRLQFFRLVYGEAGNRGLPTVLSVIEAAKLLGVDRTIAISSDCTDMALAEGYGKLLAATLAVAMDALPRGGSLRIENEHTPDKVGLKIYAEGERPGFEDNIAAALNSDFLIAELSEDHLIGRADCTRFGDQHAGPGRDNEGGNLAYQAVANGEQSIGLGGVGECHILHGNANHDAAYNIDNRDQ